MLEPGPHTPSCSLPLERGRGGDAGAERRPARERDRGERVQRRDARGLPAPGAFARGPRDPPQAGPTIARQPVLARCRRGRHALLLTGVWRTPPLPSPVLARPRRARRISISRPGSPRPRASSPCCARSCGGRGTRPAACTRSWEGKRPRTTASWTGATRPTSAVTYVPCMQHQFSVPVRASTCVLCAHGLSHR